MVFRGARQIDLARNFTRQFDEKELFIEFAEISVPSKMRDGRVKSMLLCFHFLHSMLMWFMESQILFLIDENSARSSSATCRFVDCTSWRVSNDFVVKSSDRSLLVME